MTTTELIQALRKVHDENFTPGVYAHSIYGVAADRLEALPAENERLKAQLPKWRPASEPPEEYRNEYEELKCFLVCIENGGEPFRAFYDGKHWGDGWNMLAVTHWMPLPKPPSTEEVE